MDTILKPIELAVAWIMVMFHKMLVFFGMDSASGWTWALSIVGLVVIIRILLIPLFVKQIRSSRALQLVQPEIRKIQQKYKGKTDQESRAAMSRETMAVYKENGTNPFSSCLPILLQMPIFFSLYRVLYYKIQEHAEGGKRDGEAFGSLTTDLATQAHEATFLGVRLDQTFLGANGSVSVMVVSALLIILMSLTQFYTQKQLMMKNMPESSLDPSNPMMQSQKMMLYLFPIIFAVTGINFPIGVLIYWFTTNVWSMGQQFYVIHRSPAPGSEAETEMLARQARKEAHKAARRGEEVKRDADGKPVALIDLEKDVVIESKGQRVQPKRKGRQKGPRPLDADGKFTQSKE